jgi:hypothetical protein
MSEVIRRINFDSLTQEKKNSYKINISEEEIDRQIREQTAKFIVDLLEEGEPGVSKNGRELLKDYNMVKAQILDSLKGSKMSSSQIREKSIAAAKEWAKKQIQEQWKQESRGLN